MRRFMLAAIVVASLLLIGAVGIGISAQDDGPEFIEVGATVPLTGRYAGGGAQVERGYTMAVEAINAEGGVWVEEFGRQIPINLTILDDESDPVRAVSNLEDVFAEHNVVAYLGGFGSDMHAAAAAVGEVNAVPYLGVAFALWDIHQQGYEYLFSPFWKSPTIATATFEMLDAIDEEVRPSRIGILQEQTDWGIELADLWLEAAEESGYEIVAHEQYAPGTQDYTDAILALQQADAEVLLSLPNPPDGIAIMTQMAELNYVPALSLLIRAPDAPTWMEALGTNGDFALFGPGWHSAMDFPGVEELNEAHIELIGRPADPIVGPAYGAVQILAAAIESAGTLDRDAIRDAIAASETETVLGTVTFNEDGTGVVPGSFLQYQNGRPELVFPVEFATAELVYPAPPYGERTLEEPEEEPEEEATEESDG